MSDRIIVMHSAVIVQDGTPRELYERPANRFIADFIGNANLLPVTVIRENGPLATVSLGPSATLRLPHNGVATGAAELAVRPQAIRIAARAPKPNELAGVIRKAAYLGSHMEYEVGLHDIKAEVFVIDNGTTEFIHGTRRWCVSLAYLRAGRIEIGVIYAPDDDRLYAARAGGGAFLNGRPISVSHLAHGAVPVVECGWSERLPLATFTDLMHRLVAGGIEFRRHGSGALGLADVACGLNDGYIELHINAWDALAGILLVREAGGCTNDFLADGGLRNGNCLVAVTPELGGRIAETLAAARGPIRWVPPCHS